MTLRQGLILCVAAFVLLLGRLTGAQSLEPLVYFSPESGNPTGSLLQTSDGSFYGTAQSGGVLGRGSVFKLTPNGGGIEFTTLHEFSGLDGSSPRSTLIQGTDGYLYGTTSGGGAVGHGVVFRMDITGVVTVLHSFSDFPTGWFPFGALIQAADGYFYGTTLHGGAFSRGTAFRMDSTGTTTLLHSFDSASGAPIGGLIQANDGLLYGTTENAAFRMDSTGAITVLHTFGASAPRAPLIQAADGFFYGTTQGGGAFSSGTIFRMDATGLVTVLHSFDPSTTGGQPAAALVQAADGAFYGVTLTGAAHGYGTAFRMDSSGTVTVLHSFGDAVTGVHLVSALIQAADGLFYGTTFLGPGYGAGTVFQMDGAGATTVLHTFRHAAMGSNPTAGLLQAADGSIYGSTERGGINNYGTVFRMDAAGVVTAPHSFDPQVAGLGPASLMQAADGLLYGTTPSGTFNWGNIFRVDGSGAVAVLHAFTDSMVGRTPVGPVVQASDGLFYGTTLAGGFGFGTLFRMDASGSVTLLHSFSYSDGAYPSAGLVEGDDGYLYGTTQEGGDEGGGVVFRMDTTGVVSVLHSFSAYLSSGYYPSAALAKGSDGFLYGTTWFGGIDNSGTVFRINSAGAIAFLHSFDSSTTGAGPFTSLIEGSDGSFWGTAIQGGAFGRGTVFRMDTSGDVAVLHSFDGATTGASPSASLIQANDGRFYGTTRVGGAYDGGVLFRIGTPSTPAVITWSAPASIVYGTALSGAQLNATANVPGTFVYTPPLGTVLNAGVGQTLHVDFLPDNPNYPAASADASIDVAKATPVLSWATPAPIVQGTALSVAQLNAAANLPGSFSYSPGAATVLTAGVHQLSVIFTPADAINYVNATSSVYLAVEPPAGPPLYITTVAGGGPDGIAALNAGLQCNSLHAAQAQLFLTCHQVGGGGGAVLLRIDPAGRIHRFAGTGSSQNSGDGGPARLAGFASIIAIAGDHIGNLFVTDWGTIRRIDAQSGIVTTIAGGQMTGFAGDGGPATAALFRQIVGLAVDPSGGLAVADRDNHRIRRIDFATGTIATIAGNGDTIWFGLGGFAGDGGLATEASLSLPSAVAYDGSGHLFIGDRNNFRIRRVDAVTGLISTIAGSGVRGSSGDGGPATSAELDYPEFLTFDATGGLLISQQDDDRIRRIDVTAGTIHAFAGTGSPGFSGDGGPAIAAQFNYPTAMSAVGGSLYVLDSQNSRIRRIDANGLIQTAAGNGSHYFGGDGEQAVGAQIVALGLARDAVGNLYIADTDNRRIRKVDAATGLITTVAGGGEGQTSCTSGNASTPIGIPLGLALDGFGYLYIAEAGLSGFDASCVRKLNVVTGESTIVAGTGSFAGAVGDGGPALAARLLLSWGLDVDAAGNLYIAETDYGRVRKVDTAGIISTIAGSFGGPSSGDGGPATDAVLAGPMDVKVDAQGNLLIAEAGGRVRRVDAATAVISTVAGNDIYAFAGDGLLATDASLEGVNALAVGPDGSLYLSTGPRLRKVDAASGVIRTIAGNGSQGVGVDGDLATSSPISPFGVTVDATGRVFVADIPRIRMIASNQPPRARAGDDQTVEAAGTSTSVSIDGSASSDPENEPLTFTWRNSANTVVGTTAQVTLSLPLGTHVFTLTVEDASSQSATDSATVVVRDTTAPTPSIGSPAATTYALNQVVLASYACTDSVSAVSSCAGPVPSGNAIDTATGGSKSFTVTASDAAGNSGSATVTYTVGQGVPVITWPAPAPITAGTPLGATQLNAIANVPGAYTYTPAAGTVLAAGTGQTLHVDFAPTDSASYTTASAEVTIDVSAATAVMTWPAPAAIVFGTALSGTQLSATANVAGTFVYTPPLGAVLNAGLGQTLRVDFTPTDTAYTPASRTVTIDVAKAPVTLTWATPVAITYGTALGVAQLNATAPIPGAFTYTPAAGTILEVGVGQTLHVGFVPTDAANYLSAVADVLITVGRATPVITWPTPAPIAQGVPLGAAQLNASTTVAGTFTYTPTTGAVLAAGSHTLHADFLPNDLVRYNAAAADVTLVVLAPTTASFVFADTATKGTWIGAYGGQGQVLANDATSLPSWAQVTQNGGVPYNWANPSSDVRALQRASGSGRLAATWYHATTFGFTVRLLDGVSHRVALYMVDWDNAGRSQRVDVRNTATGTLLDTRTVSAFSGGHYLVWDLVGQVTIQVTKLGASNAILSGLFIGGGGVAPPAPVATPTITPPGGTFGGSTPVTFATTTGGASIRYTTDGSTPTEASLPYTTPLTVSTTTTFRVRAFASGFIGSDTASATFTITSGPPSTSAAFVRTDVTTKGTWIGVYGTQAYTLINDASSLPPWVTVTPTGQSPYNWATSTTDVRGLQRASGSGRFAATAYNGASFTQTVRFTDGQTHQVALYFVDWDGAGRAQRVDVRDAVTGTVLDTRTLTNFAGGQYLVWQVNGHVAIQVTRLAGPNAVASALFVDAPGGSPLVVATPTISPNGGTFTNQVTVALASATAGATIHYTLDGSVPTTGSFVYAPPLTLVESATLSVRAFAPGMTESAVASAAFVLTATPPAGTAASFLGIDSTTKGNWQGAFGHDGAAVVADATNYPLYAQVTPTGVTPYTWASSTTDVRALQRTSGGGRRAATWYNAAALSLSIQMLDGQPHRVGLYVVDWDNAGRSQRIDVRDAVTGVILDTRTVSAFSGGQYVSWSVRGHVTITVTKLSGPNAIVSGVFFGG